MKRLILTLKTGCTFTQYTKKEADIKKDDSETLSVDKTQKIKISP